MPDRISRALRDLRRASVSLTVLWLMVFAAANLAAQSQPAVSVDATPSITSVQPAQAAPNSQVTLKIQGQQFAPGAYVSFSDPAIHALKTERASPTQIDTTVAVGSKAKPGTATLYVANPSGASAQFAFAVTGTAANPAESAAAPASAPAQISATPVIKEVKPAQAEPGKSAKVKITGKDFAKGAKVAFSNPGIRVMETSFDKSSQLTASIQVAADAAPGAGRVFVINPDESEAEAAFTVSGSTGSVTAEAAGKKPTGAPAQQFNVANLGNALSIFKGGNKPQGVLFVSGGKLTYKENGKDVFTAGAKDIQEVGPNVLFGINTDTFHVILKSGKTYNFVAASLRPEDTSSIMTSLQHDFK